MPMTVVVLSNTPGRFRGFLASCMCEVAPGVFTHPHMNARVRERVWGVLLEWASEYPESSVVMTWPSKEEPGGQGLRLIGHPRRDLVPYDGLLLVRRS
jgi:CRISPR-associated protein Cas2